jgi:hypothetical protein
MQRTIGVVIATIAIVVSILAFLQPSDVYGKWQNVSPITMGLFSGYFICLVVIEFEKKK